ncbi:ATP-dependent RNA helicase HrpA [Morganella morganii]|nr:ATP-dependent RNA helicase HrpA [Morganella morganii]
MLRTLERQHCLYQDDVVDYLVKNESEAHLTENADGNLVVGRALLARFRKSTSDAVVWVKKDFYWRYRTPEDDDGRDARG